MLLSTLCLKSLYIVLQTNIICFSSLVAVFNILVQIDRLSKFVPYKFLTVNDREFKDGK